MAVHQYPLWQRLTAALILLVAAVLLVASFVTHPVAILWGLAAAAVFFVVQAALVRVEDHFGGRA